MLKCVMSELHEKEIAHTMTDVVIIMHKVKDRQGWQKTIFFRNKPKKNFFYIFFSVCLFLCERTNLCFIIPDVGPTISYI